MIRAAVPWLLEFEDRRVGLKLAMQKLQNAILPTSKQPALNSNSPKSIRLHMRNSFSILVTQPRSKAPKHQNPRP